MRSWDPAPPIANSPPVFAQALPSADFLPAQAPVPAPTSFTFLPVPAPPIPLKNNLKWSTLVMVQPSMTSPSHSSRMSLKSSWLNPSMKLLHSVVLHATALSPNVLALSTFGTRRPRSFRPRLSTTWKFSKC